MEDFVSAGIGPVKRALPELQEPDNGREKRLASAAESSMETTFRILCPGSKTGSIIGKGGSIIKQIRDETGARVKIADAVPGVDERVVIVSGAEDRGREWSPAQEGLFRVYNRILDVAPEEAAAPIGTSTAARLLVPTTQVGCLLGKGGSIIQQMREETGAQLRVMPKEHLPGCALPTDELVQLSGDLVVVREALKAVSARLRANPPRERPVAVASAMGVGVPIGIGGLPPASSTGAISHLGQVQQAGPGFGGVLPGQPGWPGQLAQAGGPPMEIVFRLLCTTVKTGSIIGRGGAIIRQLREQTGARIKIAEPVAGCDERVVIISGNEVPGAQFSPAQEALFLVHSRLLLEGDVEPPPGTVATTRMLVPTSQIGCLLGRGGAIIAEMRRLSHAQIRVMPRDQLPPCALDSDELLQIVGDVNAVRLALHQASTRMRANPPKARGPPVPAPAAGPPASDGAASSAAAAAAAGAGVAGVAPPQSFDPVHQQQPQAAAAPPYAGFDSAPWNNMSALGAPPRPVIGPPFGQPAGLAGPPAVPQGPAPSLLGMATLHVTVPVAAVGSIIGKGGANIAQIRNISGAKVKLHELAEGAEQREVEISGTPEQLQAAQSLLQAFIISGQAPVPSPLPF